MLTAQFYSYIATGLWNEGQGRPLVPGQFSMALGRGDTSWERELIEYDRNIVRLVDEVIRKPLGPKNITYLDKTGQPSRTATTHLRFQANFVAGEGEGTLRECGLLYNHQGGNERSVLLSYFTHSALEKGPGMTLNRQLQLNLTPRSSGPGNIVTRYLGNSNSQEFHDLDNQQPNCQIDEIRFDRRLYFGSPEQAASLNYDFCAHCFGQQLSQR